MEVAEHLINKNVQLCKPFNLGNCEKQYWDIRSHIVDMATHRHVCSYCFKNEKTEPNHPEFKCRFKKGLNNRGRRDNNYNATQNIQQGQNQQQSGNNYYRGQGGNQRFQNQSGFYMDQQRQAQTQNQQLNPQAQNYQPKN